MTVFHAPATLDEALERLRDDPAAEPVAGGTDLVVAVRSGRRAAPASILAIHRLQELRELCELPDGGLRIGALVSHATLESDARVLSGWSALSDGSALIGSVATRANGTLGGNLVNASPAMDTGAPLVVLGATAVLQRVGGERRVPVEELFLGPGRCARERDELLTFVDVPAVPPGAGSAYVRLEYRRAMEIAIVGAAAFVALDEARAGIVGARVALSAVAPTIVRVPAAEHALVGAAADDAAALARAGEAAAAAAQPISDVRADADYRRAMVAVIARRAVGAALARARGEQVPHPASRTFADDRERSVAR